MSVIIIISITSLSFLSALVWRVFRRINEEQALSQLSVQETRTQLRMVQTRQFERAMAANFVWIASIVALLLSMTGIF